MSYDKTILLVEDNDADAALAIRAFRQAKVINPLVRVRDGVEALAYLFALGKFASTVVPELPLVALVDLNIPKIGGLDVLKAIRADPRTRHLPVVILTSSNEVKDRLGAYDYFANSYILKPLDYIKFVEAASQLSLYWTKLNAPVPGHVFPS